MEEIIQRAAKFRRKMRLTNAGEYIASVFVIGFFIDVAVRSSHLPVVGRVGAALIACGAVFVMTYLALRSSPEIPRGASTLVCYRAELERRRNLLATVPRWYVAPFWPGVLLFMLGIALHTWDKPGSVAVSILVFTVVVLVNVSVVWLNKRGAAKLTKELADLPLPESG
jgi:hypothetical protein